MDKIEAVIPIRGFTVILFRRKGVLFVGELHEPSAGCWFIPASDAGKKFHISNIRDVLNCL